MSNLEIVPPLPTNDAAVLKGESKEGEVKIKIPSGSYQVLDAKTIYETLHALNRRFNLDKVPIRIWVNPAIERKLSDIQNPINNLDFYLEDDGTKLHSVDLTIWE